jgi:hypothetical protein
MKATVGTTFTVESTSCNPHLCGFIQFRVSEEKLEVRWEGEEEWQEMPWYEVMVCLSEPNPATKIDLIRLKEAAEQEGYEQGKEAARREGALIDGEAAFKRFELYVENRKVPA